MRVAMLCLVCGLAMTAGERPGAWSWNYSPCNRHGELLKRGHMTPGVRFSTSNPELAVAFAHALNFWTMIVDMDWNGEDSRDCSIQIVDGDRTLFKPAEAARAQFPDSRCSRGGLRSIRR